MKNKKGRDYGFISMFFCSFAVIFIGCILVAVISVLIKCIFNGFAVFLLKLSKLPFLLYLVCSTVISLIFTLRVFFLTRK